MRLATMEVIILEVFKNTVPLSHFIKRVINDIFVGLSSSQIFLQYDFLGLEK